MKKLISLFALLATLASAAYANVAVPTTFFASNDTPLRVIGVNEQPYRARDSVAGKNRFASRYFHIIGQDAKDLVLGTNGWAFDTNEVDLQNNFTIIEATLWNSAGTVSAPIYWGASRSVLVTAGISKVLSDPIPASAMGLSKFTRDEEYYIKVDGSVPTAGDRYPLIALQSSDKTGGQSFAYSTTDIPSGLDTDVPGAFPTTNTTGRAAGFRLIMLGHPVVDGPSYYTAGDSIAENVGDGTANGAIGRGEVNRSMCISVGSGTSTTGSSCYPNLNFSRSGIGSGSYQLGTKWRVWVPYSRFGIDELLTNDTSANTLGQLQTISTSMWSLLKSLGIEKIIRTQLLLQASSTDNWATTANQTISSGWENGGKVDLLNQWFATQVPANINYVVTGMRTAVADAIVTDKWATPKLNNNDLTHPNTTGSITGAALIRTAITNPMFAMAPPANQNMFAANDNVFEPKYYGFQTASR